MKKRLLSLLLVLCMVLTLCPTVTLPGFAAETGTWTPAGDTIYVVKGDPFPTLTYTAAGGTNIPVYFETDCEYIDYYNLFDGTGTHTSATCTKTGTFSITAEAVLYRDSLDENEVVYSSKTYTLVVLGDHSHDLNQYSHLPQRYTGGVLSAGKYALDYDLQLTEPMVIAADTEVTLCLNGKVLRGNSSSPNVIVNNGTLHIEDCDTTTQHYFEYYTDSSWLSVAEPDPNRHDDPITPAEINEDTENVTLVEVKGGIITGVSVGSCSSADGAVKNLGTLTMNGVAIVGNSSSVAAGLNNSGSASLVDCIIAGNFSNTYAGGILNNTVASAGRNASASLYGCSVISNISKYCAGIAGGYGDNGTSSLVIKDSAVTYNRETEKKCAAGVYNGGMLALDGQVVIQGNRLVNGDIGNYDSNLTLTSPNKVSLGENGLSAGSDIGVSINGADKPYLISGQATEKMAEDNCGYFVSDHFFTETVKADGANIVVADRLTQPTKSNDYTVSVEETGFTEASAFQWYSGEGGALTDEEVSLVSNHTYSGFTLNQSYDEGSWSCSDGVLVEVDLKEGQEFTASYDVEGSDYICVMQVYDKDSAPTELSEADMFAFVYGEETEQTFYVPADGTYLIMCYAFVEPNCLPLSVSFTAYSFTELSEETSAGLQNWASGVYRCLVTVTRDTESVVLKTKLMDMDCHTHTNEVYKPFTSTGGVLSAGNYVLEEDVTLTENLVVEDGTTVKLCLAGNMLNLGGYHIVNEGTLYVEDCGNGVIGNHYFAEDETTGRWVLAGAGASHQIGGGILYGGSNDSDVDELGGGAVLNNGELTVTNISLIGNSSTVEGGAIASYGSKCTVDSSSFEGNTSVSNGGGLYSNSETNLTDTNFVGNVSGGYGGGLQLFADVAESNLDNCAFYQNRSVYGGGGLYASQSINMYATSFCANTTEGNGGGLGLGENAYVLADGCLFYDNEAGEIGGAIYNKACYLTLLSSAVYENRAGTKGGGVYSEYIKPGCFPAGTLITMADGSQKKIEDISAGETVRTFDHNTGKLSCAAVSYDYESSDTCASITLHFETTDLSICGGHCLLEKESRKYVAIDAENVNDYIGKYFYHADRGVWEKLCSASFNSEETKYYALYSSQHINVIAQGMVTCPDDVPFYLNMFEMDEDLSFNQAKKQADIEKYGLYPFEEYPLQDRQVYDDFNLQYVRIAIGKGLVTKEELYEILSKDYGFEVENNTLSNAVEPLKGSSKTVFDTYTEGFDNGIVIVNGETSIYDNTVGEKANNLYLAAGAYVHAIADSGELNIYVTKATVDEDLADGGVIAGSEYHSKLAFKCDDQDKHAVATLNSDNMHWTYTLVSHVAYNVTTETYYGSLSTALDEANSEETVKLMADISDLQYVEVRDGITLDLNGHDITGVRLLYVSGDLVDTATTKGVVSASAYMLGNTVTYFAVYDSTEGGYSFFDLGVNIMYRTSEQKVLMAFKNGDDLAAALKLMRTAGEDVRTFARVTFHWVEQRTEVTESFAFLYENLADYIAEVEGKINTKALYITITGLDTIDSDITVQGEFVTKNANGLGMSVVSSAEVNVKTVE